ncbi:hypothetical protein [Actinacidiphila alni]|nr:hypothetical protein [Actinacidiphila alni]
MEVLLELQFRGILRRLEEVRAVRAGEWPAWCWMPIAEVARVLHEEYDYGAGPHYVTAQNPRYGLSAESDLGKDAARIAALGAFWAGGQHVVVLGAMGGAGSGAARFPRDLLSRWPSPCVYFAGWPAGGGAAGAFAHLEWNCAERRAELRVVLDSETPSLAGLIAHTVHLTGRTPAESAASMWLAAVMEDRVERGDDRLFDIVYNDAFTTAVTHAVSEGRGWLAAAGRLTDVAFHEAASVFGLAASTPWPPPRRPGALGPMLWLDEAVVDLPHGRPCGR